MISIKDSGIKYSSYIPGEYYIGVSWDMCFHILKDGKQIGKVFLCDGVNGEAYGGPDAIFIQWIEFDKNERGKGFVKDVLACIKKKFNYKKYITAQSCLDLLDMYNHLGFECTWFDQFTEMSDIRCAI